MATEFAKARDFHRALEIDVLARTIWGEAGRQGSAAMQAVACVVMNRVALARLHGHRWWGDTVIQVCQKPYQFSCWNKEDGRHRTILSVERSNPHFAAAMRIAMRAVVGGLGDPTRGGTHYHAAGCMPEWAGIIRPTAAMGRQIFYRFTDL